MDNTTEHFANNIAQTRNLYMTDFEPTPEDPEYKKKLL